MLEQTITDQDGDSATASLDLSDGVFVIEDDGPTIGTPTAVAAGALTLDESALADDGVHSVSANFADNFAAANPSYGTDGPGTTSYGFSLSLEGVA